MITKEQREKLEALIEAYVDASVDYADSRGDGAMALAVDVATDALGAFLDGITDA